MSNPQWKIERDAFYAPLFARYGLSFIEEAGFFFDAARHDTNINDSLNILCTPVGFLNRNLQNPCILLTTGSFCPIHDGHLAMMDRAKEAVEARGYQVAGAYISPGHDEYIRSKTGVNWIPIHNRIDFIRKSLGERSWLNVDPWEGLFNQVAVNFTDVIVRLKAYLKKHLDWNVPIFFVCGGDNARFIKTFTDQGHCVVVNRPGYQDRYQKYYANNPRIVFTEGDSALSSTELRSASKFLAPAKKRLQLRLSRDMSEFAVQRALEPYFTDITPHHIENQLVRYNALKKALPVISMDALIKGDYPFAVSREYDLLGATLLRYTNRPGSKNLDEQVTAIPKGQYTLFDDDIHTGNTVKFVTKHLENHGVKVANTLSLNIAKSGHNEILDARDFLLGLNPNSGLVVRLPNEASVRLPYVYPYVCPFVRASINDPMKFSLDVWALNMKIHGRSERQIANADYLWPLTDYLGFERSTSLYELSKYHYNLIQRFI